MIYLLALLMILAFTRVLGCLIKADRGHGSAWFAIIASIVAFAAMTYVVAHGIGVMIR